MSVFGSAGVTIAGGLASFTWTRPAGTGTWSSSEVVKVSASAPASAPAGVVAFDPALSLHADPAPSTSIEAADANSIPNVRSERESFIRPPKESRP